MCLNTGSFHFVSSFLPFNLSHQSLFLSQIHGPFFFNTYIHVHAKLCKLNLLRMLNVICMLYIRDGHLFLDNQVGGSSLGKTISLNLDIYVILYYRDAYRLEQIFATSSSVQSIYNCLPFLYTIWVLSLSSSCLLYKHMFPHQSVLLIVN